MRDDSRPTDSDSDSDSDNSTKPNLLALWRKADGAGWLRACYDVCQRTAGDDRAEHGAPYDTSDRLVVETTLAKDWATQNGLITDQTLLPIRNKGGRKHHIFDPVDGADRVVKITSGPNFGFYPCCYPKQQWRDVCNWFSTREGTLAEYCERLLLLNRLFPRCDTQLMGFVESFRGLHALTAQWIAQGRPAQHTEIRKWLMSQGFVFISAWTWYRPADQVALFDVMEKNVMHCTDGEIVPFDVIPIQCQGQFLEMMESAVVRLRG